MKVETKKERSSKYIAGPGGMNCDCCRIGSKKEARIGTNRIHRHKTKLEANLEAKVLPDQIDLTNLS